MQRLFLSLLTALLVAPCISTHCAENEWHQLHRASHFFPLRLVLFRCTEPIKCHEVKATLLTCKNKCYSLRYWGRVVPGRMYCPPSLQCMYHCDAHKVTMLSLPKEEYVKQSFYSQQGQRTKYSETK